MNTTVLTDRVPSIASTVTDLVPDLPSGIELPDLTDTVRRSRRLVAGWIPWMSSPHPTRRRLVLGTLAIVAIAGATVLIRRRAASRDSTTSRPAPERDDRSDASAHAPTPASGVRRIA